MKILTCFLVIVILYSCEKNKLGEGCRNIKGKGETQIVIDESGGMEVNIYDVLLEGSRLGEESLSIDLDNDCRDDIKFSSKVSGSAGTGSQGEPEIIILNEAFSLFVESFEDTIYYKYDSTFYEDQENIIITTYRSYLCSEKTDSIYEIKSSVERVSPMDEGDILRADGNFVTTNILLANDNVGFTSSWGSRQDTAYYDYVFSENECNNFPDSEIKYIGVKMNEKRKRKLGWIKLELSNGYKIHVLESAIEE